MPLIMGISDRVYCLEAGRIIARARPTEVRDDPLVIASYLGTDERAIHRSGADPGSVTRLFSRTPRRWSRVTDASGRRVERPSSARPRSSTIRCHGSPRRTAIPTSTVRTRSLKSLVTCVGAPTSLRRCGSCVRRLRGEQPVVLGDHRPARAGGLRWRGSRRPRCRSRSR